MKNINKILAVSLIAMLAVPAAHAKIVSESMLSGEDAGYYGTGTGQVTVKSEIASKQDTLVPDTNIAGAGGVSVTKANGVITITGNSSDVGALAERMTTAETDIDNLESGKLDKNAAITGATKTKITYDSKGLVTAGADLEASDIPSLTTQKTTALTGYSKAQQNADLAATDSLNTALGKLEKKADDAAAAAASASSTAASTYQAKSTIANSLGTATGGWVAAGALATKSTISNSEVANNAAITTNKMGAITGYEKASTNTDLAATDTLNTALGKLEKKADDAATAAANASSTAASTYQIKSTADYQMGKAGGGWTTMSDAQKGALDSGITSAGVTQITTNKNAIATLNGNDQTTGSVAKTVKDAIDNLDLANTYQAKGNYAAASHNHASSDVNAMTGYAKAQTAAAIEATDSLNTAIGKLEKKVDDAGAAATTAASDSAAGVAKLYATTGNNTDGSMTQKAVTDALDTKLTKNTAITGATKTKITYDANGLVTAGADLAASDIPTLTMAKISDAGSLATKSSISNGDVAADAAIAVSKIDGAQTTANLVTDTDGYQDDINDSTKYPNMPVVNYMISQQNSAMISGLAGKIDSTKAADKNSVMVRNGSGVYVKGLGSAITVGDDGTITVNQATNATNATNDGSGNNIANTYATKTEVTNVSNTVAGLDVSTHSGSGNVVTEVTQTNGAISVAMGMTAIPEPTLPADTAGTLVLTATPNQAGTGFVYHWEDLGR